MAANTTICGSLFVFFSRGSSISYPTITFESAKYTVKALPISYSLSNGSPKYFNFIVVEAEKVVEESTHTCTPCDTCGKCTAADCDRAETEKCPGHTTDPEQPETFSLIKVTDVSALEDGAIILLTYNDEFANGSLHANNYLNKVAFSATQTALANDQVTIKLVKSGDNWLMKVGDKNLTWGGSAGTGNKVYLTTATDNSAQWTISIAADGKATISNVGAPTRLLKYNTSSPRFACYDGSQMTPTIYLVKGANAQ